MERTWRLISAGAGACAALAMILVLVGVGQAFLGLGILFIFVWVIAHGLASGARAELDKSRRSPMEFWITRVGIVLALAVGWAFIAWRNEFHVTVSTVVVALAYLALVLVVYNLWRVGAATVDVDTAWTDVMPPHAELVREKKALLKAIKEAEFDRDMGKLSAGDADRMIAMYRERAIAVIKELERLAGGDAASVRDKIEREVKARIQVEAEAPKKKKGRKAS